MYDDHALVRGALRQEFGVVVPLGVGLEPWMRGTSVLWSAERERDIVGLTYHVAEHLEGLFLQDRRLIWDVTRSIFSTFYCNYSFYL